jgi:hypothetical protein
MVGSFVVLLFLGYLHVQCRHVGFSKEISFLMRLITSLHLSLFSFLLSIDVFCRLHTATTAGYKSSKRSTRRNRELNFIQVNLPKTRITSLIWPTFNTTYLNNNTY